MKKTQLAFLMICIAILSACGGILVNLEYPEDSMGKPEAMTKGRILLVEFEDLRKNLYKLGTVSSGPGGIVSRDILINNPASEWITGVFEKELKINGYAVEKIKQISEAASDPILAGKVQIIEINNPIIGSPTGTVVISLQLFSRQKEVLMDKEYKEEAVLSILRGPGSTGKLIGDVLEKIIKKAVPDINEVMLKATPRM